MKLGICSPHPPIATRKGAITIVETLIVISIGLIALTVLAQLN